MSSRQRRRNVRLMQNEFQKQKFFNAQALPGCHEFIIVLDNLKPNFNIGKIFRSAFVFGAHEIQVIGTKYFDPGPAKGAFKHVPTKFFPHPEESVADLLGRGYSLFILDLEADIQLGEIALPTKSAFVLGNEGLGITFDYTRIGARTLSIPQFSKMDSLNVSVAASIAMYDYVRQHTIIMNPSQLHNIS